MRPLPSRNRCTRYTGCRHRTWSPVIWEHWSPEIHETFGRDPDREYRSSVSRRMLKTLAAVFRSKVCSPYRRSPMRTTRRVEHWCRWRLPQPERLAWDFVFPTQRTRHVLTNEHIRMRALPETIVWVVLRYGWYPHVHLAWFRSYFCFREKTFPIRFALDRVI